MSTTTHIQRLAPSALARIARQTARAYDWRAAIRFTAPQRWHARIAGDRPAEAWLLTWLPGQGTELHDHGESAGSFIVLSGRLTERTAGRHHDGRVSLIEHAVETDRLRAFGPDHVHQVLNAEREPAVSLHVYAPELRSMRTWALAEGGLTQLGTELEGVDW